MKRMLMSFLLVIPQSPALAAPQKIPGSAAALEVLAHQFPAASHAFVDLPSGRTHYEAIGAGPAVILIHGVSGPLQTWEKTATALVDAGYRVIRYDLFGRGFSDRLRDAAYDLPHAPEAVSRED